MARTKSSQRWLQEHSDDEYVKRSQRAGYRSRAVFKLQEIQCKDQLIRPGMRIVDLGAAPGSWSQYALSVLGRKGILVAVDRIALEPLPGLKFVHGDFCDDEVLDELIVALGGQNVDLVMSDMAPNLSGMKAVDQPRAIYLAELAVDLADRVVRPGGSFLVKLFQGEGFDDLLQKLRDQYDRVVIRKPKASRARSREVYAVARGRKL